MVKELIIPNGNVARQAEIFRLEDLVRARIVENSLGVDTRLVRECTVSAV